MLAALQEREAARELLRTDPANSNLRRTLKAAGTRLKCVRFEVVQRFFEEFVSQLEVRIRDGDQAGFYKHLKGMISRAGDRAASYISRMKNVYCFKTLNSFVIGGCNGSALYLVLSRQRSTLTSPKSSRCGPRAYLSMIYLRYWRWRKRSRACQTERPSDPMSFRPNCSNSS